MGKGKRRTKQRDLVSRAVSAGRGALRQAESRIPPDLRRQVERRLKNADMTARAAIKQLQTQVKRATTRADVNSVLKRIDGLTKQARQITAGGATPRRRASTTTERAATRTRNAAPTTRRRAASSTRRVAPGAKRAAPARRRRSPIAAEPPPGDIPPAGDISVPDDIPFEP
jgi:hypothetical protein